MASILPSFPTGSTLWTIENVGFDLLVGILAFVTLVWVMPWMQHKARMFTYRDGHGVERERPLHQHWFARFMIVKIIALVALVWGIFLYCALSVGWANPFVTVGDWFGIKGVPGWLFDIAYARANGQPSGAHLLSWVGIAGFGVLMCYKGMPWPPKKFADILADPFQGIAGLLFLGGVHEGLWLPFYYVAYGQYLDWALLPEVLRDVSFAVMCVMFVLTFWKYPNRNVNLRLFKWPIAAYSCFLLVWFFVPALLGYHLLPITTLNNPSWGLGPYEETPWFSWLSVNLMEVVSWVIIWAPSIILVLRHKRA